MNTGLGGLDMVLGIVRLLLLAMAGVLAVFCLIDWAVRTRRVNAFGSTARFARSKIDPFISPIERRVVSAGGNPASAPLWAEPTTSCLRPRSKQSASIVRHEDPVPA